MNIHLGYNENGESNGKGVRWKRLKNPNPKSLFRYHLF
jgi:hypothetical protein